MNVFVAKTGETEDNEDEARLTSSQRDRAESCSQLLHSKPPSGITMSQPRQRIRPRMVSVSIVSQTDKARSSFARSIHECNKTLSRFMRIQKLIPPGHGIAYNRATAQRLNVLNSRLVSRTRPGSGERKSILINFKQWNGWRCSAWKSYSARNKHFGCI